MMGNLHTKYEQLYNDTQLSLHQYHQSIVNLLDAVRKRSSNDQLLISNIQMTSSNIKESLMNIQSIQQKKFLLNYEKEQLFNMVCYRINYYYYYGLPKICIECDTPLPPWKPNL